MDKKKIIEWLKERIEGIKTAIYENQEQINIAKETTEYLEAILKLLED